MVEPNQVCAETSADAMAAIPELHDGVVGSNYSLNGVVLKTSVSGNEKPAECISLIDDSDADPDEMEISAESRVTNESRFASKEVSTLSATISPP